MALLACQGCTKYVPVVVGKFPTLDGTIEPLPDLSPAYIAYGWKKSPSKEDITETTTKDWQGLNANRDEYNGKYVCAQKYVETIKRNIRFFNEIVKGLNQQALSSKALEGVDSPEEAQKRGQIAGEGRVPPSGVGAVGK